MRNSQLFWSAGLLALIVSLPATGAELAVDARNLLDRGQAAEAVKLIEEQSTADERDADIWFLLADGYHVLMDEAGLLKKRGLATRMKGALEAALEIDPDHVDARRELADFYYYAPWVVGGSKSKSREQLAYLERVAPGESWAARGDYARDAGDTKGARNHYRKALAHGSRKPKTLMVLAVLEQELGNYAESISLLDELIETDAPMEQAYYYRARASAMTGLTIERGLECARQYLEQCSKCDDDDKSYGLWRQATLLKRKGEVDAAIIAYEAALRLNPELEGARTGLKELSR